MLLKGILNADDAAIVTTKQLLIVISGCMLVFVSSVWVWKQLICVICCQIQETVSAGTTNTVLRSLQPDTLYTVSLVPVYASGDGKTMSENGKTSKTEH